MVERLRVFEIRTTFGERAEAEAAARRLVEARLGACGQVDGPVTSVYRWNGAIETATEYRLAIKTSAEAVERCVEALRASHPYEVPEVLVVEVRASAGYAAWVSESAST